MNHRKLLRRYKAGYEVWRETSALQLEGEIISDPVGDGVARELLDAMETPSLVTVDIAYTPDGHYIGDIKRAHILCKKRGIKPELIDGHKVCSVGFCEREKKWYGWSHRAIFGFGIGSHVKPGDCAYEPKDKEDFRQDCLRFWDDEHHSETWAVAESADEGEHGVHTFWRYADSTPNEKLHGQINSVFAPYPDHFGRGEWTAQTLDDAKRMAVAFAESVG